MELTHQIPVGAAARAKKASRTQAENGMISRQVSYSFKFSFFNFTNISLKNPYWLVNNSAALLPAIVVDCRRWLLFCSGLHVGMTCVWFVGKQVQPLKYSVAEWHKYSCGATKEEGLAGFLQALFDILRSKGALCWWWKWRCFLLCPQGEHFSHHTDPGTVWKLPSTAFDPAI